MKKKMAEQLKTGKILAETAVLVSFSAWVIVFLTIL